MLRWMTICLCLWSLPVLAAEQAKVFRAGAYAMDVTPLKFPISMNGNMQDHPAKSAHDPLHARCLVLDDGATRIALVVVDNCVIPRELMDSAKKQAEELTELSASHILISATHAHSCPAVTAVFQSEADADYVPFLAKQIALGIAQAEKNLAPAHIGWGSGQNTAQVFNRRWTIKEGRPGRNPFGLEDKVIMNPGYNNADVTESAGPVDPQVSFLCVRTPEGKPLALFANYSLHYVGGTGAGELSADYFGVFAERIGQLLKAAREPGDKLPPFVGVMSNGTSGDVNNVNFALKTGPKRERYEQMRLVADSVAQTVAAAYPDVKFHAWVPLKMLERELELRVRKPTADEVTKAREQLSKLPGTVYSTLPDLYRRETLKMAEYPDAVKLKVQAIRIGELAIAAIPCEVFTEVGLELKAKSPIKPLFTISLANGYNGYLPNPRQHALGGYETWRARSSYLEVEASTAIVKALLEMLQEAK